MSEYIMSHTGAQLDEAISKVLNGYILPVGNLTDSLITRNSSSSGHRATIPAGYYVNDSFAITEWATGQITGSGTAGGTFFIPYSSIGFIPKVVLIILNTSSPPSNAVLCFLTIAPSGSRAIYRTSSSNLSATSSYHATINESGVTFPALSSSVKYATNYYRWFALR